jgi:uncharacterized membrane protein
MKHDIFLFIHFIGLAMAVGTGFANLFLASATSKMEPAERGAFMSKAAVLVRMGQIGLGLLLLSGFALATPYWKLMGSMPTFIAKLSCVGLLIIMVTITSLMARKAKTDPSIFAKLRPLGLFNFILGLTIVILAVFTFH